MKSISSARQKLSGSRLLANSTVCTSGFAVSEFSGEDLEFQLILSFLYVQSSAGGGETLFR